MGLSGRCVPKPLSGRRSRQAWPANVGLRVLWLVPVVLLSGCASGMLPGGSRMSLGRISNPVAGVLGQRVRGQSSPLTPVANEVGDLPPLPGESAPLRAPKPAAPPIPAAFPTPAPPTAPAEVAPAPENLVDELVQPAACATCGQPTGMLPLLSVSEGGCATCGTGMCTPGSKPSYPWPAHTFVGRAFGELYQCLCCPDPCYEPRWIWEANAGFFLDWARPQTITRIRYDDDIGMVFPDRDTYFWARADGKGIGPQPPTASTTTTTPTTTTTTTTTTKTPTTTVPVSTAPAARPPGLTGPIVVNTNTPRGRPLGLGPAATRAALAASAVNRHAAHVRSAATTTTPKAKPVLKGQPGLSWDGMSLYQEVAAGRSAFFVEIPYRLIVPDIGPTHAGFADMNLGTKSMLLDCELLQLTFQFKTFLPVGNPLNGLGTGHVSLEPSLLSSLKLSPSTYLQGQLAEWIPIAGDTSYSGSILHYHLSLNQVLMRVTPDSPLIGTLEFGGWSFQGGLYTDPYRGPTKSSGSAYYSLGPGLRMVICDGYDIGVGTAFALTSGRWAEQFYRVELRIRF
jgi:hypothetical protein